MRTEPLRLEVASRFAALQREHGSKHAGDAQELIAANQVRACWLRVRPSRWRTPGPARACAYR